MTNAAAPPNGVELASPSLALQQLAARLRDMSARETDPRLRHKLSDMALDYERKAKLQTV